MVKRGRWVLCCDGSAALWVFLALVIIVLLSSCWRSCPVWRGGPLKTVSKALVAKGGD